MPKPTFRDPSLLVQQAAAPLPAWAKRFTTTEG